MFYQLRKKDGTPDAASGGTWASADGVVSQLAADDVEITIEDTWVSPDGGEYPSRWNVRVPRFGIDLTVQPVIADQELFTTVRYWEGAVNVIGEGFTSTIFGQGYVELTGYAE